MAQTTAGYRLRALADFHEKAGTGLPPHEMRALADSLDALGEANGMLAEVIRELEALRRKNPMNGDGSNVMLDRSLEMIVRMGQGPTGPLALEQVREQCRTQHSRKWDREHREFEARYNSPEAIAQRRRDNAG